MIDNQSQDTILNFFDEQGNLVPLKELKSKLEQIYEQVQNNDEDNFSSLEAFINPENQINSEEVIETFSFLDRSLYLYSEITHDHTTIFSEAIRFWNEMDNLDNIPIEKRKPIKIYIDSPGGDLDATFSIIDAISLSKTPVWTITLGSGWSGGFFIGISGHKRFGYPHSSYLFHEGSSEEGGIDAHKFLQGAKFYERKLKMLKEITLKQTNMTENDYEKHKKDDLWLTAEEALNLSVIDEILDELI